MTIEADPRHAEIMIRDLNAQEGRRVGTPMVKEENEKIEDVEADMRERQRD